MHFTNITNVQASFCLAGGTDCLENLLHSPPKNAEASAKPIQHVLMCTYTQGFSTRSKQLSCEFLCSSYWFLTDPPLISPMHSVQEQLIITLYWASKPEMMGEIIYATFPFFIHIYMLLMAQFSPSVTALLQKYWQWGTIICFCPSVPPDEMEKNMEKIGKDLPNSLKQSCHL